DGVVKAGDPAFKLDGFLMHTIEQLARSAVARVRVIGHVAPLVGQRRLALDQIVALALEPLQQLLGIGDALFARCCLFFAHPSSRSRSTGGFRRGGGMCTPSACNAVISAARVKALNVVFLLRACLSTNCTNSVEARRRRKVSKRDATASCCCFIYHRPPV